MGKLSQELAGGHRQQIIEQLTRAFADEWFAHYNYFIAATRLLGPTSATIARLLKAKSRSAYKRAGTLAERIQQLGGELPDKLLKLPDRATDKPFKLPEKAWHVKIVLRAVLDAERTSIRTYSELFEKTKEHDPVTGTIALGFLQEAIKGEEQMEKLLAEEAPEMSGR